VLPLAASASSGVDLVRRAVSGRPPGGGVIGPGGIEMPDEVWVVMSLQPGLAPGSIWRPTSRLQVIGANGIDQYNGDGVYLQRLAPDEIDERIDLLKKEMREFIGEVTPRRNPEATERPFDNRVLPIKLNASGQRDIAMKDYVSQYQVKEFDDWPLQGPRSLHWVLRFCGAQTGGGPVARAQQLMAIAKLSFQDGGMNEYLLLARIIELGLQYDGLSVANLASFELMARRFQLLEEKYKTRIPESSKSTGLDAETDTALFLGLGLHSSHGRHAICMMPELSAHVGDELAKEAAITKGRLKAHEMREQVKKLAKGKPGDE